jgi:hypothetical protein
LILFSTCICFSLRFTIEKIYRSSNDNDEYSIVFYTFVHFSRLVWTFVLRIDVLRSFRFLFGLRKFSIPFKPCGRDTTRYFTRNRCPLAGGFVRDLPQFKIIVKGNISFVNRRLLYQCNGAAPRSPAHTKMMVMKRDIPNT